MGFKELRQQAKKIAKGVIDNTAISLSNSNFTISSKDELKGFIKKSANTKIKNKETGEEKKFIKRCIVIFGEEKSDFFKKALYKLPILWAKAFSQNVNIKLAKSSIAYLKLEDYKVKQLPSMVIFENTEVYKIIQGEENILKVVKNISLDINKTIDKL